MINGSGNLQQEFAKRRQQFITAMKKMDKQSIAILPANALLIRNGDVHYPFRQDSNFEYLTGFPEPDAIAVFIPDHEGGEFILFNQPPDPQHEIWQGRLIGQEGACQHFGADRAFALNVIEEEMPKLLQGRNCIYFPIGKSAAFDQRVMRWVQTLRNQIRSGQIFPQTFKSITSILQDMRIIKSPFEIDLMRKAAAISVSAHENAMKIAKTAKWEYELAAEITHECQRQGCRLLAYDSIVASGANACVLHYTDNQAPLNDGELILIDAAGEYRGYAADITRTFPQNGVFSAEQKAIYEIVLQAQKAGIEKLYYKRSNKNTRWNEVQQTIIQIITEGLIDLKILQGDRDNLIAQQAYLPFYMHNFGHWLGMDVHDIGTYKTNEQEWRSFEPNMVLTVEPGIYIRPNEKIDPRWWNIGIRIEDDVRITEDKPEILSGALVKEIADIEAFMR